MPVRFAEELDEIDLTPDSENKTPQPHKKSVNFGENDTRSKYQASRAVKGQGGGQGKQKKKKSGGSGSQKDSVSKQPSHSKPEWYEELNEEHVAMFKKVFELLDKDGGGTIDASELYNLMKDLDIAVTLEEIEKTLMELDKDGNGEIDFDEFLYAMTESDLGMGSEEDKSKTDEKGYSRRQTLFFTAITKFAIKESLGEIERFYAAKMRQAPHVIGFYTAGVRLIGLNDRQLAKELQRMQHEAKDQDSPYAKPLPFVDMKLKNDLNKKKKKKPTPPPTEDDDLDDKDSDAMFDFYRKENERRKSHRERRKSLHPDSSDFDIIQKIQILAEKGSIMAKIPGIEKIPQIRNTLRKIDPNDSNATLMTSRKKRKSSANSDDRGQKSSKKKPQGWTVPHLVCGSVPLPRIVLPGNKLRNFTIEDVRSIRKRVTQAVNGYYSNLKRAHVKTACEDWVHLSTDQIRSPKLRHHFQAVYRAYAPHNEEEVFVICPWLPRPRYTSNQPRGSRTLQDCTRPVGRPPYPLIRTTEVCSPRPGSRSSITRPDSRCSVTSTPRNSITPTPGFHPNSIC